MKPKNPTITAVSIRSRCAPLDAPQTLLRDEPTMAEAVAEIRTRGPQPPLDYARREPLHTEPESPARRAAVPVLLGIFFLAGVLVGMGMGAAG